MQEINIALGRFLEKNTLGKYQKQLRKGTIMIEHREICVMNILGEKKIKLLTRVGSSVLQ